MRKIIHVKGHYRNGIWVRGYDKNIKGGKSSMTKKGRATHRKAQAMKIAKSIRKGDRKGQSISIGGGYYMKAGKVHKYSKSRDTKLPSRGKKTKRIRKPGEAPWRGDVKGKRV